ncbi:xenotropic and polytropic retrovirus receptor 1 homolog isoform X3 [Neoarius graeffei]|uniref:xenotropic and polytropic retrovirus receptor 1 homolog isoform X3 n=1 Tax=Neoarius graeffei TaxID=443677 RepID=UPI00298C091F|nr:xenotropic and polytropic retrovirus receptor 1 homolog isoform X3 [Neoarius graeffei]
MKFTEHLAAHITPEWRKQYIQYEAFKEMLYSAQDQAPSIEEKLAEAQRRFATLQNELQSSLDAQRESSRAPGLRPRRRTVFHLSQQERCKHRNIKDLQLAFSEFYLSLILLQNYQNLNFTGFRKILKKHDKIFETARGADWRVTHVEVAPFYTCKKITQLISETEALVTTELEGGDRQKAMKRLRVPPLGAAQPAPAWTTFRVGLYCGVFIVLMVTICITGIAKAFRASESSQEIVWPLVRIYRGGFLLVEFLFLLGINTYGWRQAGVNHVLIFELNPRNNLSHQHLFEIAGFLSMLWCVSILSCLFSDSLRIPIHACPLALYGFFLLFLINPLKTCYYKSRFWLLKLLFRVVTAPFHRVGFADFWLADQLNSLVVVLMDLEYLICFYSLELNWLNSSKRVMSNNTCNTYSYGVRAVIQCLPAWFRFVQCLRRYRDTKRAFPHLVNAGKYSTTFFVVTFAALYKTHKKENPSDANIFFYLLIACSIINSCYTLIWDLKMDWGLFDRNAGENALLREEIVYPQKAYYYCAILEDVILRFAWTIPLSFGVLTSYPFISDILATVLAPLEVFRRFVWNFFRLENEHLNNCGEFRAVRDISVAPLNADDQTLLEQMMDQEDGVRNRQGKKSWKRSYSMSLRRPRLASQSKMRDTKVLIEDTDDDT